MRRLLRFLLGAALLQAMAVTACGPAAAPRSGQQPEATAPSQAGAPIAVSETVSWKHGIVAAKADASYLLMAREKGFFRKHGLEVEYVEFQSDATMAQALVAGELDSMEANPSATISAVEKGSNLKIIGTTMPGMPYALYSRKEIGDLHDLQGKTLGISAPGALPEVIAKAILLSQGISPDSVTFANAGGDAQRFAALKGGKVDAVAAATEFISETNGDPNIKVLALASDYVPQYPRFMLITNGDTLKNKPRDAIVGFLSAHMEGLRYALGHRDEALALCAKVTNEPATSERCTEMYDLVKEKKYVDPNMEFDLSRLTWLQELRIQLGLQQEVLPNEKLVDLSFRDEALKKIGMAA
jgi:NitT/TauT family transport system substrate-binding protein